MVKKLDNLYLYILDSNIRLRVLRARSIRTRRIGLVRALRVPLVSYNMVAENARGAVEV